MLVKNYVEMKGRFIMCFGILVTAGMMLASRTASGQTYTGYLKLDDTSMKGPDSVLVTMTIPTDTYIRDTVYLSRSEMRERKKDRSGKAYYATPWMFGVKTNLLSDVIAVPYVGVETQLTERLSLDLSGWFTPLNIFYPNKQTSLYGFSPELRWWLGGPAMKKGYFLGAHGNVTWYTLEWRDSEGNKVIYQNGIDDLHDAGSKNPAWSAGLTHGYLLPLDRKGHWNLEFYMGVGYAAYQQKRIYTEEDGRSYYKHEKNSYIGITKVGINLTYSFSLRRVKPAGAR